MKVSFVKQDQWIGHYYDEKYHYVCLIPCIVFKWRRKVAGTINYHCNVCGDEVERGMETMLPNGAFYCAWCKNIEMNICFHYETRMYNKFHTKERRICVNCKATQIIKRLRM